MQHNLRTLAVAVSFLLAITLAGCTGSPASADASPSGTQTAGAPPSAPPPAPEPTVQDETGSITGSVTDDELRPLSHVAVVLVQTLAEVRTDAEGRFTFNELEPRDYGLSFQRVGYEEVARRATVAAGEVTEIKVTLKMIPLPTGPYHLSIPKKAYLKATWVFLTSTGSTYNSTGLASTFCDPCIFHLDYDSEGLVDVKSESWWTPFALQPAVNEDVWLQYFVKYAGSTDGESAQTGYVKNRKSLPMTAQALSLFSKNNSTRLKVNGALLGINFEHKPEIWTTFAYGEKLSASFTALPPP